MSVDFETVATKAWSTSSGCTVTKPSGLAEGDLMVGHIVVEGAGSTGDLLHSGWTSIVVFDDTEKVNIQYKVADSSDVAASNFTFGTDGSKKNAGAIYRISSAASTAIDTGTFDTTSAQTSHTFDTADLTPTFANSLFLYLFHAFGGTTGTTSAYAITTSNPTWTEAYDLSDATGTDTILASAYANRPEVTSTGDATLTTSASTNGRAVLIAIPEQVNVTVTGTIGTINLVGNDGVATGAAAITGTVGTISLTGNDGAVTTPANKFTNPDKSSTTWTNPDKT